MSGTKIQSVDRAVDILEALAAAPGGMKLADLADSLQLKPPTAHHLVQTLLSRGLVERYSSPTRYALGPALVRLAATQSAAASQVDIAEAMAELSAKFPAATINFARLIGSEVLTVLRMSPDQPGALQRPEHQVMAPYSSASGLAIQAFGPAEQVQIYTQKYLFDEYAAHHWKSIEQLEDFLTRSRAAGAVVAPDNRGFVRASVPYLSESGVFIGVMGLSVPVTAENSDQITENAVDALCESTNK